jgi:hypothetical protein
MIALASYIIAFIARIDVLPSGVPQEYSLHLFQTEMRPQMTRLSSTERNALPTKSFAEPDKRKYPIENEAHAKNALSRVLQSGTPAEKAKVREAVKKKYPSLGKKEK